MEYIEIETPIEKHKVKLKKWMTGGDRLAINNVFLSDVKINIGENPDKADVNGKQIADMISVAIQKLIVEVDGSSEDCYSRILEMHYRDYEILENEVNKIIDNEQIAQKKS